LARRDTLADVELGDPVLDPTQPQFDFYKWVRILLKLMEEDDIKNTRTGVTFKNLNVSGSGAAVHLQKTVASPFMALFRPRETFNIGQKTEKLILNDFNGTVKAGEMLVVLGRPGSGCSTLLKCLSGDTQGLRLKNDWVIHYDGVPQQKFKKELRGEAIYSAEEEKHFPHLTVRQTLEFAAAARTPSARIKGIPRHVFSTHLAQVAMAVFGLSHTKNTKVGDDYIRGVSGGERKRVSIAELALAGSMVCCWDNSTRGLDAATALEFTRSLKISSHVAGTTQAVAIYQASQAIYDLFDKTIVLYEGRQIYFGPARTARRYFEEMGWHCPARQTTADFLTAITNPRERKPRKGFESKVPRTAHEFERYWQQSEAFLAMQSEIEEVERQNPPGGPALQAQREAHRQAQAKHVPPKSPDTISVPMQIRLCTIRAYQRVWNDRASTIATVISQIVMALIIGSIFFNTPSNTDSFFAKGSVLFFAILLNALLSISEINGCANHFLVCLL
jgi:ABC-type multidrug transport system ATPase subunit